jgi:ISXO2-like transposase domain
MNCFSRRGKKGENHGDPADPPRCRANKQRGHGTSDNDRPPVVGTSGRESGQVRWRVVHHTEGKTLKCHVTSFTTATARGNPDEWQGYNRRAREHVTVNHGRHEGARDEDDDGSREVPTNTVEGRWTGLRNFLRPFRGVHKQHLAGYVAMHEHAVNLKQISPTLISALVQSH